MTPLWVHWAARAAGTILAAGGAVALWRNDPTRHLITLAPARAVAWWTRRRQERAAWEEGRDLDAAWQQFERTRENRRIKARKGHHLDGFQLDKPKDRPLYQTWRERGRWLRRWCWWYVPAGSQRSVHGYTLTRGLARARLVDCLRGRRTA